MATTDDVTLVSVKVQYTGEATYVLAVDAKDALLPSSLNKIIEKQFSQRGRCAVPLDYRNRRQQFIDLYPSIIEWSSLVPVHSVSQLTGLTSPFVETEDETEEPASAVDSNT